MLNIEDLSTKDDKSVLMLGKPNAVTVDHNGFIDMRSAN